jgi:hypothetical protein
MAAGVVHIPWYATGFRGDALEEGLAKIARVALQYGATDYRVYRSRDDRYRFLLTVTFESKLDWERYWEGHEFTDFRVNHQGHFQVPILYAWNDLVAGGGIEKPQERVVGPAGLAGDAQAAQ